MWAGWSCLCVGVAALHEPPVTHHAGGMAGASSLLSSVVITATHKELVQDNAKLKAVVKNIGQVLGMYGRGTEDGLIPDYVAVLDHKLVVVLSSGVVQKVTGNSKVVSADDLEAVSLIDLGNRLYVATSSLGKTHVFTLERGEDEERNEVFIATGDAFGELPIPDGETVCDDCTAEIEAVRCWSSKPEVLRKKYDMGDAEEHDDNRPFIMWGGRSKAGVWLSWAPFDIGTGKIDEENIPFNRDTFLPEAVIETKTSINLCGTGACQALSSLDLIFNHLYFTAACSVEGQEVQSIVGNMKLKEVKPANWMPTELARFESMKRVGMCASSDEQLSKRETGPLDNPGAKQLYLVSDDGRVAVATLTEQGGLEPVNFPNLDPLEHSEAQAVGGIAMIASRESDDRGDHGYYKWDDRW